MRVHGRVRVLLVRVLLLLLGVKEMSGVVRGGRGRVAAAAAAAAGVVRVCGCGGREDVGRGHRAAASASAAAAGIVACVRRGSVVRALLA